VMNPLYRKMFRDPRAAKRATGILASSAPLMTAAQKAMAQNKPMRAQRGTSVNTQNRTLLEDLAMLPTDVRAGLGRIFSSAPSVSSTTSSPRTMPDSVFSAGRGQPVAPSSVMTPQQRAEISAAQQQRAETVARMGGPRYDSGPFFQVGDVNLGNMFSDGSPLDILRAARTSAQPLMDTPPETSLLGTAFPKIGEAEIRERQAAAAQDEQGQSEAARFAERQRIMALGGGEALSETPPVAAPGVDPGENAGLDAGFVPKSDTAKKEEATETDQPEKTVSTVDPAIEAAKKSNAALEGELANIRGGGDSSTEMNLLTTGTAGQRVGPSGGQPESQKDVADFGVEYAERVEPEEVSLSDIEKRAKEIMGFDPNEAEEDRKNSFWMNLTRAGLAIAAGESENALTNVAKGLSFGLEGYAKDTARIDAKDEAQRKEYRATLRTMIKDEKDASIATAQMINSYNQSVNALKQNAANAARQDLTARELAQFRDNTARELAAARNAIAGQTLEFQFASAIARNKIDIARLESDASYRKDKLDSDELYKTKMLAIDEWKAQPNLVKIGQSLGYTDDEGEWTTQGLVWAHGMAEKALVGSKGTGVDTSGRFLRDIIKNTNNKQTAIDGLQDSVAMKINPENPTEVNLSSTVSDADLLGYLGAVFDASNGDDKALDTWITGYIARSQ